MKSGQRFDVFAAFLSSARFLTVLTTATIGAAALSIPSLLLLGLLARLHARQGAKSAAAA